MAMVAVTAALIGFFAFVIMRVTTPQMTTLFTDLSAEDSSGIIKDLERQAIPFELRNEGAVIMVPKDKVTRLRMKLAEGGLPKGGGVGYEIFDKSDALGTTSFVQNINHLRALEGELARTIRAIDRIQAARVHLVLPERPLFSRETPEPSASIVVRVRGSLEPQQIRAIRHVVASAVNGLKPQRVSIVDEAGRLLADGAGTDTESAVGDERRTAFEKRMRNEVEAIVSSVVGQGRARVQLTADFDYNKITQTSDKFDPEGRVLRSSQTREESALTAENNGQVTVNNELPGNQANGSRPAARDQSKKSEETNNYEISRTTKTEVTEAGRVNRISVAVLVDGAYSKNEKGEMVYQDRSKEQLDRIATLVRSAIGFDQKRGDQVEVVNLRFAEAPAVPPVAEPTGLLGMLQFTKDDVMYVIELGVMMLLGLVVLFMVIRPLVKRILASEVVPAPAEPAPALDRWHARKRRARPGPDCRHQRRRPIDRRRPGPGPGPRAGRAPGRRTGRTKSERDRLHCSPMAERTRRETDMAVPQTTNANDITTVISALASRQSGRPKSKPLSGPKRAAILMLALGEQYGGKVWALLDDDEVRELSIHMSTLGTVEADVVEDLLLEFVSRMSASGALMGTFDATERLLQQYLPPERVNGIMDEIRGPAGRNMWEKLSNVQEEVLANYLKNEYPQTIAVVLSKLKPEHAARVLAILPEDLALDVVGRMLKMEAVQKEVIERVEQTLRTEFMSNLSQTRRRDAHEVMAEIFNNFDRQTETRFITSLEEENRESAERIKALMFTFDDLIKLDSASAQTLMRNVDKDKLGIALKSANEEVRAFFLGNMSSRAGKMLLDDMAAMGPVRLRDVDEAQALLVNLAKDMAAKGEITLTKNRADDELVY